MATEGRLKSCLNLFLYVDKSQLSLKILRFSKAKILKCSSSPVKPVPQWNTHQECVMWATRAYSAPAHKRWQTDRQTKKSCTSPEGFLALGQLVLTPPVWEEGCMFNFRVARGPHFLCRLTEVCFVAIVSVARLHSCSVFFSLYASISNEESKSHGPDTCTKTCMIQTSSVFK